jgi:hypothetical protein
MMIKPSRVITLALFALCVALIFSIVGLPLSQFAWSNVSAQYNEPTNTPAPEFGPDPGPLIGTSGVDANGNPIADVVFPGKGTIFVGSTKVTVDVFARLLPAFYVGTRSVIDIPYIRAADIFAYYRGSVVQQFFADPIVICLRGTGNMLFAAASGRPRTFLPIDIAPSRYKGFTCAYIGQPGTLALVEAK